MRSLRSVFSISLRISHGKYIAWRKANKTEVEVWSWNLKKRSCQDICRIVRFLRKSLTSEELSVKDKIKLSVEYFDSEA